jgi:hypothetical protein
MDMVVVEVYGGSMWRWQKYVVVMLPRQRKRLEAMSRHE